MMCLEREWYVSKSAGSESFEAVLLAMNYLLNLNLNITVRSSAEGNLPVWKMETVDQLNRVYSVTGAYPFSHGSMFQRHPHSETVVHDNIVFAIITWLKA